MTKKKINIAIVGLGNIGSYLYLYLKRNINELEKKTNAIPNIMFVSAKNRDKKRKFKVPNVIWEKNFLKIAKNKKVDVVVELIGGAEGAAKKLVFESLKNGKHVVTANKALVAKYGDQLAKIAEKNKVNLEFEAAVCGGVPIVRSIKEGLIANKTSKVHGIFNGTSNFILSEMFDNNLSFKQALIKAQNLIDLRIPSFLNVKLKISKKNNLVELKSRLKKIDLIEDIYIQKLNNEFVFLTIKYLGKLEKIIKQLTKQKIILKMIDEKWSIEIIS